MSKPIAKSRAKWLENDRGAYGGSLMTTRRGRARPRPVSLSHSMHVVLRSEKAKGEWSLKRHESKIKKILAAKAHQHGVNIHATALLHNHMHWHLSFSTRAGYTRFIRAVTTAIAMAVTGASRWKPSKGAFWARRPFTRIVGSLRAFARLKEYIEVNQLEGLGYGRIEARLILAAWEDKGPKPYDEG
jgi:REP element-mobilizing transposase RayT